MASKRKRPRDERSLIWDDNGNLLPLAPPDFAKSVDNIDTRDTSSRRADVGATD